MSPAFGSQSWVPAGSDIGVASDPLPLKNIAAGSAACDCTETSATSTASIIAPA
jgi:hypothetical protein